MKCRLDDPEFLLPSVSNIFREVNYINICAIVWNKNIYFCAVLPSEDATFSRERNIGTKVFKAREISMIILIHFQALTLHNSVIKWKQLYSLNWTYNFCALKNLQFIKKSTPLCIYIFKENQIISYFPNRRYIQDNIFETIVNGFWIKNCTSPEIAHLHFKFLVFLKLTFIRAINKSYEMDRYLLTVSK